MSQLLFSLSPSSADYGRGRNWIGHVDTSCPKGGQYPAGKEEEGSRARSVQRAQHGVCRIEAMSLQRRRRMISRSRESGGMGHTTKTTRACKLRRGRTRGRSAFQEERMEWESGNNRRRRREREAMKRSPPHCPLPVYGHSLEGSNRKDCETQSDMSLVWFGS